MTDTRDWADKIAKGLMHRCEGEMYEAGWYDYETADEDEISAALRKAKADGVREVAQSQHFSEAEAHSLRMRADKIEKGEA